MTTELPVIVVGSEVPAFDIVGAAVAFANHHDVARDQIVAVVDTDPAVIKEATIRGVDAVIWDTPDNRHFSWHFRATPDDIVHGLQRRLKEWRDRAETRADHVGRHRSCERHVGRVDLICPICRPPRESPDPTTE